MSGVAEVLVILDFMCPWSFIGLQSLHIAKQRTKVALPVRFIPFEFDQPGTYPAQGVGWKAYCEGYGPAKARFLLEEKLPRAFALGAAVGINFSLERRIVHTHHVNQALILAQKHGAGEQFALRMLHEHFELLHDPNDPEILREVLSGLGVPHSAAEDFIATPEVVLIQQNMELRQQAMKLGAPPVPKFTVHCGGQDVCSLEGRCEAAEHRHGPTTPEYFVSLLEACSSATTSIAD